MQLGGGTGTTRPGRVQATQPLQDPCKRAKPGKEATQSLKDLWKRAPRAAKGAQVPCKSTQPSRWLVEKPCKC